MTNILAATAAHNKLPCREFPANAPDHIGDGDDPRDAWADGWNACLDEVKRRARGTLAKTMEHDMTDIENRAKPTPLTAQATLAHYQREAEHAADLAELKRLREEVALLKADAERLDGLEQLAHASSYSTQIRLFRDPAFNAGMNRIEVRTGCGSGPWERPYEAANLRAAIDAALAASKEN